MVEQHAALQGEAIAVADAADSLSYRELNHRANAVARRLQDRGFRRGWCVQVAMPRGRDLAVVLLAVLKAGGCYLWIEASQWQRSMTFMPSPDSGTGEEVTIDALLGGISTPAPNLPVLTRQTDTACVVEEDGVHVLVPHSTVVALTSRTVLATAAWFGEPGAFDLWLGLMTGATVTVAPEHVSVPLAA